MALHLGDQRRWPIPLDPQRFLDPRQRAGFERHVDDRSAERDDPAATTWGRRWHGRDPLVPSERFRDGVGRFRQHAYQVGSADDPDEFAAIEQQAGA